MSVNDVLEQLDLDRVVDQHAARTTVPPDPAEARLLETLSAQPCHVDDIVRNTGMPSAQVTSLLALMELKGMVRQVGTMTYART